MDAPRAASLAHSPLLRQDAKTTRNISLLRFRARSLVRLTAMRLPNVLHGLFGVCAMPGAARAERLPAGYKACFPWRPRAPRLDHWWTSNHRRLATRRWRFRGVGSRRNSKCAPGSTEPAPFPTGPADDYERKLHEYRLCKLRLFAALLRPGPWNKSADTLLRSRKDAIMGPARWRLRHRPLGLEVRAWPQHYNRAHDLHKGTSLLDEFWRPRMGGAKQRSLRFIG